MYKKAKQSLVLLRNRPTWKKMKNSFSFLARILWNNGRSIHRPPARWLIICRLTIRWLTICRLTIGQLAINQLFSLKLFTHCWFIQNLLICWVFICCLFIWCLFVWWLLFADSLVIDCLFVDWHQLHPFSVPLRPRQPLTFSQRLCFLKPVIAAYRRLLFSWSLRAL